MRVGVLLAVLLVFTSNSFAVTYFGAYDCGTWLSSEKYMREHAKTYLIGYLSGLNAALATANSDPLNRLSSVDQAFLWMDNYCRANPLENLQTGTRALYDELRKRKD